MLAVRIACILAVVLSVSASAEAAAPIVREEQRVVVGGVEELWRLEWTRAPSPACGPEQPEWSTCPCSGFAFGESGPLVLVRKRPGKEDERLDLGQFFIEMESPADAGEAVLRRWNVEKNDDDESDSPGFTARVQARPPATVMRFGDYDHDGQATEFLLQVGTLPCGKKMMVAIGVSSKTPRLHVFHTVERPDKPLVLQASQWEVLLSAQGPVTVLDWQCGDHGSDSQTDLELSADDGSIHATKIEYECTMDDKRGPELGKENL